MQRQQRRREVCEFLLRIVLWLVGDHVGRPIQALVTQPGLRELLAAFAGEDGGNGGLVGFGGSGGERKRHFR